MFRQASTSAEHIADGDAETIRKDGINFAQTDSRGKRRPIQTALQLRKGFLNHGFWRRSFLPFFRRRKKGSRRRHLRVQKVRRRGLRIATASDIVVHTKRGVGRDDAGIAPHGINPPPPGR